MKTPGIYTDINTQTQRTGLPTQDHRIVFVTGDTAAPSNPTPIYDTATANVVSGTNSNAGRMIAAALSVSQGVRVETMGKPDLSDSSGGSDTNAAHFLKFKNDEGINSNDGLIGGLVYSIDGGAISAVKETLPSVTEDELGQPLGNSLTMYAFLSVSPMGDSQLSYGRDGGYSWDDAYMPIGLDVDKLYWFGMTNTILQDYFDIENTPIPEEIIQKDVMLTVYPANRLPSANIDYDLFNLIIDPAQYTQSDLEYFSERGVIPAVKNPDGSYTLRSQLTFPLPLPPAEV